MFSRTNGAVAVAVATLLPSVALGFHAFSTVASPSRHHVAPLFLSPRSSSNDDVDVARAETSRRGLLSSVAAALLATTTTTRAYAEDEVAVVAVPETTTAAPAARRSLTPCPVTGMSNANACASTSSTGRVAAYSPPWTFSCAPDEAYDALLRVLRGSEEANLGVRVTYVDPDKRFLTATAVRLATTDELEFLVRPEDGVVVYRSGDAAGGSAGGDFGANKQRLEKIRKRSNGVFGVMGGDEAYSSGDVNSGGGGNGVLGQLKAFYGLQSGEGYQDVFD